ncbi:enoyl-CoA hydratase/isomerase family protein [Ramlibacter sp. AW1]|uniref:Enoyl-CoA hydratase/isomerase family protein n=1 Tax=Ramlibacter aurantiacus TaxID=2801330 RepID=A0A937D678_9BURK|nr:enoyl-CoA hydratase/isomerase family protein [Ramlibacter aurantiacus]MBL0423455.1 enoyl-CoA hydratase/isomerase family protein [Ramlibacter aurantiacus]
MNDNDSGLLVHREGAVLRLTLNTPDNGNLVSAPMGAAVIAALQQLDPEVRVVVLRGAGADFCAGRVSPTPAKGAPPPSAERLRQLVAQPALDLYDAIKAVPVPTVAVVQGRAHGVGTALAAVCDITIAAEDSRFCIPEMERDIPPTLVMAALCDRVPLKTLSYLVLSRHEWSGREAQAGGLVSWTVPAAQLDAQAQALVETLSGCAPAALRACKQYLAHAPAMSPQAASAFAGHLAGTALSARYQ